MTSLNFYCTSLAHITSLALIGVKILTLWAGCLKQVEKIDMNVDLSETRKIEDREEIENGWHTDGKNETVVRSDEKFGILISCDIFQLVSN